MTNNSIVHGNQDNLESFNEISNIIWKLKEDREYITADKRKEVLEKIKIILNDLDIDWKNRVTAEEIRNHQK